MQDFPCVIYKAEVTFLMFYYCDQNYSVPVLQKIIIKLI